MAVRGRGGTRRAVDGQQRDERGAGQRLAERGEQAAARRALRQGAEDFSNKRSIERMPVPS